MYILNHKKKMDCPLPELTLPKKVCGELITIIKDAGVPHSLICTNPPLDLFHGTRDYLWLVMDESYITQGSYQIEIVYEFLSISYMTGSLLWLTIEWSTIHVGMGKKVSPPIMTYMTIFYPGTGSRIFGTLHKSMEYPYLTPITNLNYIENETYFLWKNSPTTGSRLDNWRIWTDADYTSKLTPSTTSSIIMAHTLKKILWCPPRWISPSHPFMACSRILRTKIMAIMS